MVAGVGFSLSRCVFHCLQARGMTVVTGILRAGVLRGGRSDARGGLVGIAVGHKGEIGVGKLFWMGLGWSGAGQEPPVGRKTVLQGEADRSG